MAKRAIQTTDVYLREASLPEATETYTVIPHGDVMDKTEEILKSKNLKINDVYYRCNQYAQVAQGIYHLNHEEDSDIGLLFTWTNSYDKSTKFRCCIGGFVHQSSATIIKGNLGSWGRKHTGTAHDEALEMIEEQISLADQVFSELVADKNAMKDSEVTDEEAAGFVGEIYMLNELLTGEQLSLVKREFKNPSYTYSGKEGSLWQMYNGILIALQKAHPRTWMDQHRILHHLLCKKFDIIPQLVVNANQNSFISENDPVSNPDEALEQDTNEDVLEANDNEELVNTFEDDSEDTSIEESSEEGFSEEEVDEEIETINMEETFSNTDFVETDIEEAGEDDEFSWPCMSCNEMQGADSVFYEGQLCETCYNAG